MLLNPCKLELLSYDEKNLFMSTSHFCSCSTGSRSISDSSVYVCSVPEALRQFCADDTELNANENSRV